MLIFQPKDDFSPEQHWSEVPLQQGTVYRHWQQRYGREVLCLVAEDMNKVPQTYIQCVALRVPQLGTLWLASGGPLGGFANFDICEKFYTSLTDLCMQKAPDTFAIRIQNKPLSPYVKTTSAEQTDSVYLPPYYEQVIDLDRSEEKIVATFSTTARRELRKAQGQSECVIYTDNLSEHFAAFYTLVAETAKRKKFSLHSFEYYRAIFTAMDVSPQSGFLVLCKDMAGNTLSGALVAYIGSQAYYLLGGSTREGHLICAPILIQYTVIMEAKKQGKLSYNLGAIELLTRKNLKKLSVFKRKFGGNLALQQHPCDIVIARWRYRFFRLSRLGILRFPIRILHKIVNDYIPRLVRFVSE